MLQHKENLRNHLKISVFVSLKHVSPLNKDEENIRRGPAVLETVWIRSYRHFCHCFNVFVGSRVILCSAEIPSVPVDITGFLKGNSLQNATEAVFVNLSQTFM